MATGTGGDDRLAAVRNGEVLRGLGGDDVLRSDFNRTTLWGDEGDDRLTLLLPAMRQSGPNPVSQSGRAFGGEGDDVLVLGRHYEGDQPIPAFVGVPTAFLADGGDGNDSITLRVASEYGLDAFAIDIAGGAGDDRVLVEVNPDDLPRDLWDSSAEILVSGGAGADRLTARALAAADPYGGILDLNVQGEGGADTINASGTAANGYAGAVASMTVDGGRGADTIVSLLTVDSLTGFEHADHSVFGGTGNDRMTVETVISAYEGRARITAIAGAGDDRVAVIARAPDVEMDILVDGGLGDDAMTVTAGAGAEVTGFAGVGDDVLRVTVSGTSDNTQLREATVEARGMLGDDTLVVTFAAGAVGSARLSGGAGNDLLRVVGGDRNALIAGPGEDRLIGGPGTDGFVFWDYGDPGTATIERFDREQDALVFRFFPDFGAPGLADDLAFFEVREEGGDVVIDDRIRIVGAATGAVDSVDDLVADAASQLLNTFVL